MYRLYRCRVIFKSIIFIHKNLRTLLLSKQTLCFTCFAFRISVKTLDIIAFNYTVATTGSSLTGPGNIFNIRLFLFVLNKFILYYKETTTL
jgi:hypothetical protein